MDKGYTLFLTEDWDLTLDGAGNIATAAREYAVAQNVANAVRLFTNDAYFAQNKGIPHMEIDLGQSPTVAMSIRTNRIKKAALSIGGVTDAHVTLEMLEPLNSETDRQKEATKRTLGGDIILTLENGLRAQVQI